VTVAKGIPCGIERSIQCSGRNLDAYITGFSKNVRDIFEWFKIDALDRKAG
jgi:hypothetical protein